MSENCTSEIDRSQGPAVIDFYGEVLFFSDYSNLYLCSNEKNKNICVHGNHGTLLALNITSPNLLYNLSRLEDGNSKTQRTLIYKQVQTLKKKVFTTVAMNI